MVWTFHYDGLEMDWLPTSHVENLCVNPTDVLCYPINAVKTCKLSRLLMFSIQSIKHKELLVKT